MARRSRHSSKKQGSVNLSLPIGVAAAVAVLGGGLYLAFHSAPGKHRGDAQSASFSISSYRTDASRLTGNRYRLTGRVENIETQGNDRIVAISMSNNKQERLPLLVKQGSTGGVNLTRGDTFIFEVECCTGQENGQAVKGIMVVRNVETK